MRSGRQRTRARGRRTRATRRAGDRGLLVRTLGASSPERPALASLRLQPAGPSLKNAPSEALGPAGAGSVQGPACGARMRRAAAFALGLIWISSVAALARAEDPAGTAATADAAASSAASQPAPAASPLSPPSNVAAKKEPDDNGHGIQATWSLSPDDAQLLAYEVWMAAAAD